MEKAKFGARKEILVTSLSGIDNILMPRSASSPRAVRSGWSHLRNLDRDVPSKPRLIGGFEGHNAKENTLPGRPALWAEASQSGSLEREELAGGAERLFVGYLRLGSSLKCAASSFLQGEHPDPGCRISAHNRGITIFLYLLLKING